MLAEKTLSASSATAVEPPDGFSPARPHRFDFIDETNDRRAPQRLALFQRADDLAVRRVGGGVVQP